MATPLRIRLAKLIAGEKAKEYIPSLSPLDGWPDTSGRLKDFRNKSEQLTANVGMCFTANNAITEPASAIKLKAGRKNKKTGEIEEAFDDRALELMNLIANPNNMHSGEQLMDLHYGYRNFTGEAYTMMFRAGREWTPKPGQLPQAIQEVPAHEVEFKLNPDGYTKSTVKWLGVEYPVTQFIRDIKPDLSRPMFGISVVSAAAAMINNDLEMREWNNRLMANGANPSVVFTSNEPLSDESFARWDQQFADEHTGAMNSGKPLLIEGGDVKPFMLSPKDLDFLQSRQFTNEELLMMWRVNPYIIGAVKDVNLATAKAARIQHAEINIEPRVRQWVRQLNVTMVSVFDPALVLYYDPIVPEDDDAKLAYHQAAVNKWETIDEARAAYGDEELPEGNGAVIIVPNTSTTLDAVIDAAGQEPDGDDDSASGQAADGDTEDGTNDPDKDGKAKSLAGVKKKT